MRIKAILVSLVLTFASLLAFAQPQAAVAAPQYYVTTISVWRTSTIGAWVQVKNEVNETYTIRRLGTASDGHGFYWIYVPKGWRVEIKRAVSSGNAAPTGPRLWDIGPGWRRIGTVADPTMSNWSLWARRG